MVWQVDYSARHPFIFLQSKSWKLRGWVNSVDQVWEKHFVIHLAYGTIIVFEESCSLIYFFAKNVLCDELLCVNWLEISFMFGISNGEIFAKMNSLNCRKSIIWWTSWFQLVQEYRELFSWSRCSTSWKYASRMQQNPGPCQGGRAGIQAGWKFKW